MKENYIIESKEYKKIIDEYKNRREEKDFSLELDDFSYFYSMDPSIGEVVMFKVHGIDKEYITRLDGTTRVAMGKLVDAKMKNEDYTDSVMVLLIGANYLAESLDDNKNITLLEYHMRDFKKDNK